MFTLNNCMDIKKLVNKENVFLENNFKDLAQKKRTCPEENSKDLAQKKRTCLEGNFVVSTTNRVVPYGSFEAWPYRLTHLVEKSSEKISEIYVAACFAKNCTKTFKAETTSLAEESLIAHLEEHLKNSCDEVKVIAEKKISLEGQDPIFSIEIKWPTVRLCKDPNGAYYYNYKCNECNKVRGRKKAKACMVNYDSKKHLFTCCKDRIEKILEGDNHKILRPCCLKKKDLANHLWICHFGIKDKLE